MYDATVSLNGKSFFLYAKFVVVHAVSHSSKQKLFQKKRYKYTEQSPLLFLTVICRQKQFYVSVAFVELQWGF